MLLAPAVRVSGSIVSDPPVPISDIEYVFFIDAEVSGTEGPLGRARIDDGKFGTDLPPGQYRVRLPEFGEGYVPDQLRNLMPNLASQGPGWRITSAMFGNIEALDFPIEIGPGEIPHGRVTVTQKPATTLSGRIVGSRDASTNYHVVAFASDERYWTLHGRRNVAVEADPRGRFIIRNLPAGHYRLAVVPDFDSLAGVFPAFIRQILPTATAEVVVRDGESTTQDVRVK